MDMAPWARSAIISDVFILDKAYNVYRLRKLDSLFKQLIWKWGFWHQTTVLQLKFLFYDI